MRKSLNTLACQIPDNPLGILTEEGEVVAEEGTVGMQLCALIAAANEELAKEAA